MVFKKLRPIKFLQHCSLDGDERLFLLTELLIPSVERGLLKLLHHGAFGGLGGFVEVIIVNRKNWVLRTQYPYYGVIIDA